MGQVVGWRAALPAGGAGQAGLAGALFEGRGRGRKHSAFLAGDLQ